MIKWDFDELFKFEIADIEYNFAQVSILDELLDNGFADYENGQYLVTVEAILNLTSFDKKILFLPEQYPFAIWVQSKGTLNQHDFVFDYGYYDFAPNGTYLSIKEKGPIIYFENCQYLLSLEQYRFVKAIKEFNSIEKAEKTFTNNLLRFSEIKKLSETSAAILDSYLQNENVYRPGKIVIDLDYQSDELEIIPKLDGELDESFIKNFDLFPSTKEVYATQDKNGNRKRIVFDAKLKESLKTIKTNRKTRKKEKIAQIIENPESVFDNEAVDYHVIYSDRVKEIGLYKPRFYPFISPFKSQWIPGYIIEDQINGTQKVRFETKDQLQEFSEKMEVAKTEGKNTFFWNDTEINTDDAEKIVKVANLQFKDTKEPIIQESQKNEENVLIIKENADELEYIEHKEPELLLDFILYTISNLSPKIFLKEHQKSGIAWLQMVYNTNQSGCLLADDMGLGKTLQVLYFIEWHLQNISSNKPYLIVAPVSLLENWDSEYKKYFKPPSLPIKMISSREIKVKNEVDIGVVKELQKRQLILTNYETLRSFQLTLCAVDYAIVVLDEAQKAKTPGTLVTNAVKSVKADFKIAMTGTPVENTFIDLWCIVDFSVPGLLGSAKDFAKKYHYPTQQPGVNIVELGENLRKSIDFWIMRRMKKDVAKDLPNKYDDDNSRKKRYMPQIQLDTYLGVVNQTKMQNREITSNKNNEILQAIWAIRDISDHPYLHTQQIQQYSTNELIETSAKLLTTVEILNKIKDLQEKVIIFADRKETQKLLQKVIMESFKISASIINGDTPALPNKSRMSRQQAIDRFEFKVGFNVIIMSPLAAGIGLNVVGANHVIHYTRHWNPAKEDQATDRAYRIGQSKDVFVYYPMAIFPDTMKTDAGEKIFSFDETLDILLSRKRQLATASLYPSDQIEIKPDELFRKSFGFPGKKDERKLGIKEIEALNPLLFEAYIAVIFKKKGYEPILTPQSSDKGADVVALGKKENILIQVKQSQHKIGVQAIQEIVTADKYYASIFNTVFTLIAISNNNFTDSAAKLAGINNVQLIGRADFIEFADKIEIYMGDVLNMERTRKENI
jgi:SNF2 family DNA or RNA helicase/HJR/Mrr/RecB family endonuclease